MSRYTLFKNDKLELLGTPLKVDQQFPEINLVDTHMQSVSSSSWKGKQTIILSIPSLDTPVCSTETKRFNKELSEMNYQGRVLAISRDLPFAQKRWCGAEGVEFVTPLSDYRYQSFGENTGTLIKEWQLLSRAVFVIDAQGAVKYVEYVETLSDEPDYNALLDFVKG